jgi:hypothetical protein
MVKRQKADSDLTLSANSTMKEIEITSHIKGKSTSTQQKHQLLQAVS